MDGWPSGSCSSWRPKLEYSSSITSTTNVVFALTFSRSQLDFEAFQRTLRFLPSSKPTHAILASFSLMTSESMKYVCMLGSLDILKRSLYTLPHVCERKHFIRECCSSFFVRQARGVSFYHLTQLVEHAFPFRIREFASGKFNLLSNSNRIVSLRNNLEGCCWACSKAPRGTPWNQTKN